MTTENRNNGAAANECSRSFDLEDSACATCKWASVWTENPDAENGPGSISYAECEQGYEENFCTPGGCFNWKLK